MEGKLELIVVPVSDVDRGKEFYLDVAGFDLHVDHRDGDFRVVQITPRGSACSIALMPNADAAGTLSGLHLVVRDINAAWSDLERNGGSPTEIFHFESGRQEPGPDAENRDYNSFFSFSDPDGNGWLVQEVKASG